MGSSGAANCSSKSNVIDASVGALVWVRRRNGTWWPGQIMGLDEFTSDSLVSPAAGTPVKLLGREDPSIDWYNLEKSKRVKAFRCGEYDEIIERAKASAANGTRKKVRYATREDAILHALEIENAHTSNISVDLSTQDDFGIEHGVSVKEAFRMSISGKKELVTNGKQYSGGCRDDSDLVSAMGLVANSDFDAEYTSSQLSEFGVSFEVPNHVDSFKVPSVDGKSRRTPNDSEEDGTGGIKRMRGLEDLGVGVRDPKTVTCISNGTLANGSKVCTSSLKRKRTQVGHVPELLKRKNRRRQLTKVLESTAMVSVPLFSDHSTYQAISDSKFSGVDSDESRKGSSGVINNTSDSTGVSCENGSSVNITEHAYDAPHVNEQASKEIDDSHGLGPPANDSSEKLFDVPFVEEETNLADSSSLPELASEMHYQAGEMRRQFSWAEAAPEALQESGAVKSAEDYGNNTCQRTEKGTSKWQSKGKRNLRRKGKSKRRDMKKYTDLNSKALPRLENKGHFNGVLSSSNQNVDSDGAGHASCSSSLPHLESHIGGPAQSQRLVPYRQSRLTINSRYQSSYLFGRSSSIRSKLHDVKLEVNADCEPSQVPLLSLVSSLNSKAIIGHPLSVAVLDDGYCDHLISQNKSDTLQVTAQKTVNLQSASRNSEARQGQSSSKSKKVQPHRSRSKSSKNRKNGFSSKKTRRLSSLPVNRECHRKTVAEKPNGSVIACVPLKLVFSRINEALNRSARHPHPPSASPNSVDRLLGT